MKRPVKELVVIVEMIYRDLSARCRTDSCEQERDIAYLRSRIEHEGLSFLTITLPNFSKEFERALREEKVGRDFFVGLKKYKCLPAFLRGFTLRIFNPHEGGLLDEPCIESIKAVRQVCLAAKKIKMPCTSDREAKAVQDYVETEQKLSVQNWELPEAKSFASVARILTQNLFNDFDIRALVPKHGPGAVYEGYRPNQKFTILNWPEAFGDVFPYDWFACCSLNHLEDSIDRVNFVDECGELPIRLSTVPKTQTAPRIIGIEPTAKMFIQQSIKSWMYSTIEGHWITSGHVNFTDQSINQLLALTSSVDLDMGTLDMKKASDLVQVDHVEVAYEGVPDLLEALLLSRSTDVELPSGEYLHLRKFASMGSATCFPVEAMHFFFICVAALLDKSCLPHTLENIYRVSRGVYVYGDDIIVPVDAVPWVLRYMSALGSVVNVDKSFYTGSFRESCGMDAYAGERVTPVYIRNLPPQGPADGAQIASYVSLGNQLYKAGYERAFQFVRSLVDKRNGHGQLPSIQNEDCPGLFWLKPFANPETYYRYRRTLQRDEIRIPQVVPFRQKDRLSGWPALLRWLLEQAEQSEENGILESSTRDRLKHLFPKTYTRKNCHLETSVRRGAVSIKRRWVDTALQTVTC